jgi:hypothetical protein
MDLVRPKLERQNGKKNVKHNNKNIMFNDEQLVQEFEIPNDDEDKEARRSEYKSYNNSIPTLQKQFGMNNINDKIIKPPKTGLDKTTEENMNVAEPLKNYTTFAVQLDNPLLRRPDSEYKGTREFISLRDTKRKNKYNIFAIERPPLGGFNKISKKNRKSKQMRKLRRSRKSRISKKRKSH